jgi:DNA helicase-2/ATP-dependent DNA helicase PcrA
VRLPRIRDLTEEQKRVYLYAPTDKHVLVQGPPGTGKTLIACLRAKELSKKGTPYVLGMFNRVLAKYSSNASGDGEMQSQTLVVWFRQWWERSGLPPHNSAGSQILIEAPFDDKDEVKQAGATWASRAWRPWGRKPGAWQITSEQYFASPDAFKKWRLWHQPPIVDGNAYRIAWGEVARHILEYEDSIPDEVLDIGTLLIDEGQDFPQSFYKTLQVICAIAGSRKGRIKHPPRCFVLADENQQITEENSTLEEIASALKVVPEHRYTLLDNFRNSKEIAELARSFFNDVGVLPRLPSRSSERPIFSVLRSRAQAVERIRTWVRNNPGKETGVLVFDEVTREALTHDLTKALEGTKGRLITVQTYSWKSREQNSVDDLQFDAGDVVTVLNMQSCKGLEFDAVMIVGLREARIGLYGPDKFRMQMFVAVSRGREWVQLMDFDMGGPPPAYVSCLPGPDVLEREGPAKTSASASATPALRVTAPVGSGQPAAAAKRAPQEDWRAALARLVRSESLVVDDRSENGGAIWVEGGMRLEGRLKPLGFAYSEKRSAWWRKP